MIVLKTQRLSLREFTLDDLDDLYVLYGDPQVMKYVTGEPRSYEETLQRLHAHMADYQRYGFGLWAAILKENLRLIGRCGLEPVEDGEGLCGDVAWMFLPEYWGRGLATEVARAIIPYGLETLKIGRLIASAHPENTASIRVMQKVVMEQQLATINQVVYRLHAPFP